MASPRLWQRNPSARIAIAWTLLLASAGSPSPAQAQDKPSTDPPAATGESCPLPPRADAPLRDFKLINDLYLEVDGKRVAADLYRSETAGAMLVISSALPSPVILRATSLLAVDLPAIEKTPNGVANVKPGTVPKPLGTFEVTDVSARFTAGGRQAALLPTPPLLGLRRAEEVESHNPEYVGSARKYVPDPGVLTALKKEQRAVTVKIFYGSWCPHCATLVPNALRIERELRASKIRFEYFGVSRPYGRDPEVKKNGVRSIPTAVVYVDGREVGRITDDDSWKSPESALRVILEGMRAPGAGR